MIDSNVNAARAMIEREDYALAWPAVSEVLNVDPEHPQALYLAGCILRSQGHVGMALQMFRRALIKASRIPNVWMHYGACLHDTHQYEDAREAFRVVIKALPNDPMPPANIGATYVQEGNAREAVEWADRAMKLDPENKIAHIAKAFGSLGLGRWDDGWKFSDALYGDTLKIRVYNPPEREEPMWDGTPGKTVVVQADQGLGDMLMFAQCLNQMVKDCKKVIVETNERLAPLFKRNFPECDVYGTLKTKEISWPLEYEIDAHIHISALGKFYRRKDEDFPRTAYIHPDKSLQEKWLAYLEKFPKPWVGIAWKGGIARTNMVARSMELKDLAPIIKAGGTVFSLAYQDIDLEVARWNLDNAEQVIVPNLENQGPYDNTLAFISCLDHVVTVQTTVSHACGCMGKKAQVIVNSVPQWRYVYGGDSLMWYPENSVRIYRQAKGEKGWSHVVARVASDYKAFVLPMLEAA